MQDLLHALDGAVDISLLVLKQAKLFFSCGESGVQLKRCRVLSGCAAFKILAHEKIAEKDRRLRVRMLMDGTFLQHPARQLGLAHFQGVFGNTNQTDGVSRRNGL